MQQVQSSMAFAQSGIRSFRPPANSPAPFPSETAIRSVLNTKNLRTAYTKWSTSGLRHTRPQTSLTAALTPSRKWTCLQAAGDPPNVEATVAELPDGPGKNRRDRRPIGVRNAETMFVPGLHSLRACPKPVPLSSPQRVRTSARTTPTACQQLRCNHARNQQDSQQTARRDGSFNP